MLEWLMLGAGMLGYLCIGYIFGKLTSNEYFNKTPTEELGLRGRLKRILLFPSSYHEWDNRGDVCEEEPPLLFRAWVNGGNFRQRNEGKEGYYCKIVSFLWPLRLIPASLGLIQIAFFVLSETTSWIVMALHKATSFLGGLFARKQKSEHLPTSLSKAIEAITRFKAEVAEQEIKFEGLKKSNDTHIRALEERLSETNLDIERLKERSSSEVGGFELLKKKQQELHTLKVERSRKYERILEKVREANLVIEDKLKLIQGYHLLEQMDSTSEGAMQGAIDDVYLLMDSCQKLISASYRIEVSHLCKDEAADTRAIGVRIADGWEHEQKLANENLELLLGQMPMPAPGQLEN